MQRARGRLSAHGRSLLYAAPVVVVELFAVVVWRGDGANNQGCRRRRPLLTFDIMSSIEENMEQKMETFIMMRAAKEMPCALCTGSHPS